MPSSSTAETSILLKEHGNPTPPKCPACRKRFSQFSAMLNHLENKCHKSWVSPSEAQIAAKECRGISQYITSEIHDTEDFAIRCPRCGQGKTWRLMSAFVAHVESGVCDMREQKGIWKGFLGVLEERLGKKPAKA